MRQRADPIPVLFFIGRQAVEFFQTDGGLMQCGLAAEQPDSLLKRHRQVYRLFQVAHQHRNAELMANGLGQRMFPGSVWSMEMKDQLQWTGVGSIEVRTRKSPCPAACVFIYRRLLPLRIWKGQ